MNGHYPLFKKQDIDAFFALFQNNLANFVVITVTLLGMGFPESLVFGRIIPGVAVAVIAGNLYYAHMAKRLAKKEKRTDVTALSYGVSTPVMFVFLFGVTAPALAMTNDHELAWKIAVAAAFLSGLVEAARCFFWQLGQKAHAASGVIRCISRGGVYVCCWGNVVFCF